MAFAAFIFLLRCINSTILSHMNIANVSYQEAKQYAHLYDNVLSISDPDSDEFIADVPGKRHLHQVFLDTVEGDHMPTTEHVFEAADWFTKIPDHESVLVHCHAGVSRSAAMTLLLLAIRNPNATPKKLVAMLQNINPFAAPNEFITAEIDRMFDFGGRLEKTVDTEVLKVLMSR